MAVDGEVRSKWGDIDVDVFSLGSVESIHVVSSLSAYD